jgi:hypothetical protein
MEGFLFGVLIIGFLFLLALTRERHRERMLRMWVERHPGSTLHRGFQGFEPDRHPGVPALALLEEFLGRPPIGFASAMEVNRPQGDLWLVEYRTTPLGAKTDRWFTLAARRFPDSKVAGSVAGGADFRVSGPWVCLLLPGLMTPKMLDSLPEALGA